MKEGSTHDEDQCIVEFVAIGRSVKVTIIDPVSMQEVCIIGPRKASRQQLTELALRKLHYVLRKKKDS